MRDGFELALDHLGRKVGGLAAQVIYEDDQQKPEVGKQKTDKLIGSDRVNKIIEDNRIAAVTLTGSVAAGASVASIAG
jgi:ABC-type branched-subunit amino acid transport system substrate-binding protein